jgi:hypothetical protein
LDKPVNWSGFQLVGKFFGDESSPQRRFER